MSYLDTFGNDEEDFEEVFLNYLDPEEEVSPEYVEARVRAALEEYTFDEILEENEMAETEALGILFELGYIGLPEFIYDEDDDTEMEGLPEEA